MRQQSCCRCKALARRSPSAVWQTGMNARMVDVGNPMNTPRHHFFLPSEPFQSLPYFFSIISSSKIQCANLLAAHDRVRGTRHYSGPSS